MTPDFSLTGGWVESMPQQSSNAPGEAIPPAPSEPNTGQQWDDEFAFPEFLLDRFEPLSRVSGETAQGVVIRARQRLAETAGTDLPADSSREVALKILKSNRAMRSPADRMRFAREITVMSQLDHPNVATVYDGGIRGEHCWYAMQLIDGVHLDEYVRDHAVSPVEKLRLFQDICDGLQAAHERGVIHRDLKPSNILVSPDGRPRLLDFGLAAVLRNEPSSSVPRREVVGNLLHMAPEQAKGDPAGVTTRADVYALGVILYHMLTARHPREFDGQRRADLERAAAEPPCAASQAGVRLDADLCAILDKALAMDPAGRYPNAGAMTEDLDNYLAHRPVTARPHNPWYLVRRFWRRHRPAISAIAAGVMLAITATTYYITSINAERNRTETQRARAVRNAAVAMQQRDLAVNAVRDVVYAVQRSLRKGHAQLRLRRQINDIVGSTLERIPEAVANWQRQTDRLEAAKYIQQGDVETRSQRLDAARKSYNRSLDILERAALADPHNPKLHEDLCIVHARLAHSWLAEGSTDPAEAHIAEASECFQDLKSLLPDSRARRRHVVATRMQLGDLYLARNQADPAREHFRQALRSLAEAGDDFSSEASAKRVMLFLRLGDCDLLDGDAEAAAENYGQALKLSRGQVGDSGHNPAIQHQLGRVLCRNAEAAWARSQIRQCRVFADEAAIGLQEALAADPERADVAVDLASACYWQSKAAGASGDRAAARRYAMKGRDLLTPLLENEQTSGARIGRLAERLDDLAGRDSLPSGEAGLVDPGGYPHLVEKSME
jgi:serine/threonine protein kinase